MEALAAPSPEARRRTSRRLPWSLLVGLGIVAALVVVALVNRFFIGDPNTLHLESALQGPSLAHPFGTDNFGRDILTRVLASTGIDLMIGFFCVIPAFCIGTTVGIVAGYFGGWGDALLMRIVDVMVAFPFLVLVIAIVAALGAGITNMFIAVAAVGWVSYARLARSETQVIRAHDYVAAARVLGFSRRRILARHVLPNAVVQPLIYSTSDFIGYIILGSALGFLGLGVQPPNAEWGSMIADGQNYLTQAPWITVAPGLAIVIVGTAFVMLGDGLAVVLRPEVRS